MLVGQRIFCMVLFALVSIGSCNIHRVLTGNANNNNNKHPWLDYPEGTIDETEEDITTTNTSGVGVLNRIYNKGSVAWLYALPASILVGSTGIFPLLIFYNCPSGSKLNEAISPNHLRLLLSFSVGGLFGDVFLHLLPEAWMYLDKADHFAATRMGLWVIAGLVCFLLIEKVFSIHEELKEAEVAKKHDVMEKQNGDEVVGKSVDLNNNDRLKNGLCKNGDLNGHVNGVVKKVANDNVNGDEESNIVKRKKATENKESTDKPDTISNDENGKVRDSVQGKKIIGYLNLLANCIDNFTHGLAVGGSFIVSVPVGVCTTFAILLHEIPHEIGDFAILLKAGFSRWEAAKGQLMTASGALFGCVFGLVAEGAGDASSWVLPFTSGGFIYIACVTVIPDLVKEENFKESLKQMVALFAGISIMSVVTLFH